MDTNLHELPVRQEKFVSIRANSWLPKREIEKSGCGLALIMASHLKQRGKRFLAIMNFNHHEL
jgi:hypothetical protein